MLRTSSFYVFPKSRVTSTPDFHVLAPFAEDFDLYLPFKWVWNFTPTRNSTSRKEQKLFSQELSWCCSSKLRPALHATLSAVALIGYASVVSRRRGFSVELTDVIIWINLTRWNPHLPFRCEDVVICAAVCFTLMLPRSWINIYTSPLPAT